jgi:glycosyltransferase involved in cell wall biosynthesis
LRQHIIPLTKQYNITYIANIQNVGAQVSRNKGILAGKGDYVAFLDDDDVWYREKLAKQMELFNNPNVGMVYCKGWEVTKSVKNETRSPYNMSDCFLDSVSFIDLSYGDYIGTTSQVVIKKEAFAHCGLFDVKQPARQDYEMWIRLSQKYTCLGVNEYLFDRIKHPGEQLTKNPHAAAIGITKIFNKYRKKCSLTAKWHLSFLVAKAHKNTRNSKLFLKYLLLSSMYFIRAFAWDHNEFKKRIQLHKKRMRKKMVVNKG